MSAPGEGKRGRWVRIVLFSLAGLILGLIIVASVLIARFQPMARSYFISRLEQRYDSDVQLGDLEIALFPEVHASGDNLALWFHGDHSKPPMIRLKHFQFDANLAGFFRSPKHLGRLILQGLYIRPPRREDSSNDTHESKKQATEAFILDEVVADGTTLEITPKDPTHDPLIFDIKNLTLHSVGRRQPMRYHAQLTNPKPPGLIHADGMFGPWDSEAPVNTPVSGKYTFRDADLSVFKGISGILSSNGEYKGELDSIEVKGTTETPDFALKIGGHPVPLHTQFEATVDGTNGNTVLHPVRAKLGQSEFDVSGAIDRGSLEKHKTILLTAKVGPQQHARLEDFLKLALKSATPPMTGGIHFDARVKLPPGESEVITRLDLDGTFGLDGVKFASPDVEGKIAALSHRAQGEPDNHDLDVTANFHGTFHMGHEHLRLPDLKFEVPGADVQMAGGYQLRTGEIDFRGTAKLDAKVSEMTTGWKS
ncbi:MAG: hypothetical protein KGN84_06230, partial [Acidobacteriota bacterium]|nr:hypothetical protein [Acidobacteriota bacterium]